MPIPSKQFKNAQLIPHFVELLNQGHTVTFKLRGFSMRPFLEDGRDCAILSKHTTVHRGDAVLAEISPGRYVLHRIVNIDSLADIRGIATAFYRKGRSTPDYTSGRKWRIYSAIWTRLLPIRRYLLFIYRKVKK